MPYSILFHIGETAKLSTSKRDFSDNLLSQICSKSTYLSTCQISRILYILRLLVSHHPAAFLPLEPWFHFMFKIPGPLMEMVHFSLSATLVILNDRLNLLLSGEILLNTHTHFLLIHVHTFINQSFTRPLLCT